MTLLEKIAVQAFDDEMQQIMKDEGIDKIMDNKSVSRGEALKKYQPGSNVGVTDHYNPTETESEYGQAI